jgi:peptidoglycan glycosyltransferase
MKTTGTRSLVLLLLIGGFLAGLVYFIFGKATKGSIWAAQPYNKHLTANGQGTYLGEITDADNVVLLKSQNGKQTYNGDEEIRRATVHVVGDANGYISTGIQYNYKSQLAGYNPVTGLAQPLGSRPTGNNIKLTINSNLCKLALEKLGSRHGAAVLYNYKTGEVLCMVSSPNFDPQNEPKDLATNSKYEGVYINRVLSSSYTPGSIFKLITSASAIENIPDIQTRTFQCNGKITVNGNKITDSDGEAHEKISFKTALAKSCNVTFAQIATELGKDKMTAMANQMGFNKSYSLDGIPTSKSVYDVSKAEQQDLAWSGVGQYTDTTNPYHMVLLMGAIANDGVPVNPYLIQSITSSYGLTTQSGHATNGARMLKSETAAQLKTMMRNDVTSDYGDSMFPGLSVCAKTGTGEVGSGKQPNGWMVGFSSNESTPLAFAVVVEEGNFGRTSAGSIASAIMAAAAQNMK